MTIALRYFITCFGLSLAMLSVAHAAEPGKFSVATWNLEWFFDENAGDNYSDLAKKQTAPNRDAWNWKRDQAAAAIAKLNVDVIALQEIEGDRVLFYLSKALEKEQQKFRIAFAQGNDTFTEQDVGFLFRNIDVLQTSRRGQTGAMFKSGNYYDLSKHLEIQTLVEPEGANEPVTIITVHLRATAEAEEMRLKQVRLLKTWIADRVKAGENIIVLGDTNSETLADSVTPQSDIGILSGLDTPDPRDDLIDLHSRINAAERPTHLVPGKQFDRILVSRPLMEDDPAKRDLVFKSARVRRDVGYRGAGVDDSTQHWEHYWDVPANERDVSDHLPVVADFEIR